MHNFNVNSNRFLGIEKKEVSSEKPDINNFLVKTSHDRTIINHHETPKDTPPKNDPQAFMISVEKDANRRAEERKKRESVAQEFRKWVGARAAFIKFVTLFLVHNPPPLSIVPLYVW